MINSHSDTAASSDASEGALGFLETVLNDYAATHDDPAQAEMTLGELSDRLEERAFGMVLLVLALPCCLPFVYLLPQIVALPMLLLTGQMALGRHALWLPAAARAKTFPVSSMRDVIARARRWIGFLERFAHARLTGITSGPGSRIIGALLMIPCASILLPLPLTNTVPGIGVTIVGHRPHRTRWPPDPVWPYCRTGVGGDSGPGRTGRAILDRPVRPRIHGLGPNGLGLS
jgi:hypothetical protein